MRIGKSIDGVKNVGNDRHVQDLLILAMNRLWLRTEYENVVRGEELTTSCELQHAKTCHSKYGYRLERKPMDQSEWLLRRQRIPHQVSQSRKSLTCPPTKYPNGAG